MSSVCQDVSRDQFGVMGILMNDGRRCGSHEKFSVANGLLQKLGREWMWLH